MYIPFGTQLKIAEWTVKGFEGNKNSIKPNHKILTKFDRSMSQVSTFYKWLSLLQTARFYRKFTCPVNIKIDSKTSYIHSILHRNNAGEHITRNITIHFANDNANSDATRKLNTLNVDIWLENFKTQNTCIFLLRANITWQNGA